MSRPRQGAEHGGESDSRPAAEVVLELLQTLDQMTSPNTGNRLHHSLRTATLAEQAGADDELVVAALCHDIGSTVRGRGHDRLSAEIIEPFVRREVSWAVSVHEDFIARYRSRGLRRHARYRYLLHPHYSLARRFVDEWDIAAQHFRGDFRPLAHFESRLRTVLAAPLPGDSRKRRVFELATKPLPPHLAERLEKRVRRGLRMGRPAA